jgi:hypothetical protein
LNREKSSNRSRLQFAPNRISVPCSSCPALLRVYFSGLTFTRQLAEPTKPRPWPRCG